MAHFHLHLHIHLRTWLSLVRNPHPTHFGVSLNLFHPPPPRLNRTKSQSERNRRRTAGLLGHWEEANILYQLREGDGIRLPQPAALEDYNKNSNTRTTGTSLGFPSLNWNLYALCREAGISFLCIETPWPLPFNKPSLRSVKYKTINSRHYVKDITDSQSL